MSGQQRCVLLLGIAFARLAAPQPSPSESPAGISAQHVQTANHEETIQQLKDTIRAHDATAKNVEGKLQASLVTANTREQGLEAQLQQETQKAQTAASQDQQLKGQLQSERSAAQKTDAALRARLKSSQQQDESDIKAKDAQLAIQEQHVEHLQTTLKERDDEATNSEATLQATLAAARMKLQKEKQEAGSQEQQLKGQLDAEQSASRTTENDLRGHLAAAQEQDQHDVKTKDAQLESREQTINELQEKLKEHDEEASKEVAQMQASLAAAVAHGQAVAQAKDQLLQQQAQSAARQQQRLEQRLQAEETDAQTLESSLKANLTLAKEQDASDVKAKDAELASQQESVVHLQDMLKKHDDNAMQVAAELQSSLAVAKSNATAKNAQLVTQEKRVQRLQQLLKAHDAAALRTESALQASLAVAVSHARDVAKSKDMELQQQAQTAANQEQQLSEQLQSEESAARTTDAELRTRLAASQQRDAVEIKAKDAEVASQEESVAHLQGLLKEHDEENKKASAKLQMSLAAASDALQQTKRDAAKQEQQLKEKLDLEQRASHTTETDLRGELMHKEAKDAVQLRGAKAQLKESETSSQLMVFYAVGACVALLLVATVAFRLAYKKHKALCKLQQPLLQVAEVPGNVGLKEDEASNVADSDVAPESPLTIFKRRSHFLRSGGWPSLTQRPSVIAEDFKAGNVSVSEEDRTDKVIGASGEDLDNQFIGA